MTASASTGEGLSALADRLITILSENELGQLGELFSPDAVFWNNLTEAEVSRDERMATAALEQRIFSAFAWTEVRTAFFDGGFVQQAQVRGATIDGAEFDFPICIVVRGDERQLTRFEEYVNLASVQPILDALARNAGVPSPL